MGVGQAAGAARAGGLHGTAPALYEATHSGTGRHRDMQVVYHLGAPCTDDDRLILSLLKNRGTLAQAGVAVPQPSRYRALIRDTARSLDGRPAEEQVEAALMEAVVDDAEIDRLILSDPRFVCINRLVVQGAQIWPMIDRRAAQLRALFPAAKVEFFIGMRDPATLLPALFKASRFSDFREFARDVQPHAVAWSEMLRRLQRAHPDCPITVWCNEDTPLLWSELMHEITGIGPEVPLEGVDDLAEAIMAPEGFARMRAWFAQNPAETESQRRRVLAAFLDRYAIDSAIEETLDLPGWTENLMAEMSESYDEDMQVVARLAGVTLLAP